MLTKRELNILKMATHPDTPEREALNAIRRLGTVLDFEILFAKSEAVSPPVRSFNDATVQRHLAEVSELRTEIESLKMALTRCKAGTALTESDVKKMRTLYKRQIRSIRELAKEFKTSKSNVHKIVNGETWKGY